MRDALAGPWAMPRAAWSPAALFGAGDAGTWLDPSRMDLLAQDAGGLTPVTAPGQPVGLMRRRGGSVDAAQATAAARPTLARWPKGGRRNIFWTSNLDQWSKIAGAVAPAGTFTGQPAWIYTCNQAASNARLQRIEAVIDAPSGTITLSVCAKSATAHASLWTHNGGGGNSSIACFNLITGEAFNVQGCTASSVDLGDGWWRLSISFASSKGTTRAVGLWDGVTMGSGLPATSTGNAAYLALPQVQDGALTAAQYVTGAADITEPGQRDVWHLSDDGIDDTISVTLPAGTYTRAYVDHLGAVTVETGLALTGAQDVLIPARLAGAVYINRTLSAPEIARLTAYWEART